MDAHQLRRVGIDPDVLAHHLEVSAAVYERDATTIMAGVTDSSPVAESSSRIRDAFNDQAQQARAWADMLREAD